MYFLLINIASTNTQCKTVGGPDPYKKCVFPFTWNGNTYYGCPTDPDDSSKTWCSTSVDGRGNHVTGQKKYGFCNEACPKHSSAPKLKSKYKNENKPNISLINVFCRCLMAYTYPISISLRL